MNFRDQAQQFIQDEAQFHLGDLITEQSHPKTRNLSDKIIENTEDGVLLLLDVDQDIVPKAYKALGSDEYDCLVKSIMAAVKGGHTIYFSSCGASGRLAIILEAMWRDFCIRTAVHFPDKSDYFKKLENQVFSIMTGGDRALIRSVENFEDYQVFGRRQVIDSGLKRGDLLIALTEGGEISSVIGTMKEALERKAEVYMLFNNPPEILIKKFDRSREVLTHPGIIKLNLTTGPMALSGSTRMQATTIAMLVVGAAIEECLNRILYDGASGMHERSFYADQFANILSQLNNKECTTPISEIIDIESDCYQNSGMITYVADKYLLDIFSDTTERAPTFMIPPFRQFDDTNSPVPWVFAKDPLRSSNDAWISLLKRHPRGISWTKDDYKSMGVPPEMQKRAGTLGTDQILRFHIGKEDDPSRYMCQESTLLRISCNETLNIDFDEWWKANAGKFHNARMISIGKSNPEIENMQTINIPLDFPSSNTMLFEHLALKLIFNIISTGSMSKIGRIKGNWMVQLDATNKKLIDRATRVIAHFANISYEAACNELFKTMSKPDIHRLRFEKSYIVQTLGRLGIEI